MRSGLYGGWKEIEEKKGKEEARMMSDRNRKKAEREYGET